jgi:hypothetical protein
MKKRIFTPLLCLAFAMLHYPAFSQVQGPLFPGTTENQPLSSCTTCSGATWTSTSNISASDNQYSKAQFKSFLYCFQGNCYFSRYLTSYNYGFTIPTSATILGIKASVEGYCADDSAVSDSTIKIMKSQIPQGSNMAQQGYWLSSDNTHVYGGSSQLWGCTWLPSDINASSFGLYIKLINLASFNTSVKVDAVSITITYSTPTGIFTQTSTPKPFTVNAASGSLTVHSLGDRSMDARLDVYDLTGKLIHSQVIGKDESTSTVELGEAANGLLFCRFTYGTAVYTTKIFAGK